MKKITAYVINHGHMDIEWYQPLTSFGRWFGESIDVLYDIAEKDSKYNCYVYDGAVFPVLYAMSCDVSLAAKIGELAASGKLKLGPFYTQFDEFIPCGETVIKNCLWGDRKCKELGANPMKAGYLPDNFGHPAQLPQILNNFGIKSLFFSRGMPDVGGDLKEFVFRAPDGSKVAAQSFSYGTSFRIYENNDPAPGTPNYLPYYGDQCLSYDSVIEISKHIDHEGIARQLIDGVRDAARFYPSGAVPLFIGADHCPPQQGLTETLELANRMQDEIEFIFTDPETLSDELNKSASGMTVFTGDLIGSKYERLFFGAMTTRVYLKQMMNSCERLLFDYALPLEALAAVSGYDAPRKPLDEATRLLLLNSTHDSIHGSSLDSVHRENEYRFDRAAQLCAHSIHDSMQYISGKLNGKAGYEEFIVYSPKDHDGHITAWLPGGEGAIEISDAEGNVYDCAVLPKKEVQRNAKGEPYYQLTAGDCDEVVFRAAMRAGQVKKFFYRRTDKKAGEPVFEKTNVIENGYYRISVENGRLVICDLETGETAADFISFTEEAETGDTFDHSSPWKEAASCSSEEFGFTGVKALHCTVSEQLDAVCTMKVPLDTVGDERSASLVDMPVRVSFRLWKGVKRADVTVRISNRAKNHRVRAVFKFPHDFNSIKAGELFCAEDFPAERPAAYEGWKEAFTKELPFRDWVSADCGGTRYTAAAKGLYVFEPIGRRSIAFTLFRGVGELMRINLKSRASCCMTGIPVDGAECLRDMTFEFALFTDRADDSVYDITRRVGQFMCPPAVHPIRHGKIITGGDNAVEPFRFIGNGSFAVSVFERSYDGEYCLLRFYEVNGKDATAKIDLSRFGEVYLSDMNETVGRRLTTENGVLELNVPASRIVTLLLRRK